MSASRASVATGLAGLLLAAALLSVPAQAQAPAGEPLRLWPPPGGPSGPVGPGPTPRAGEGIEIEKLAPPDADAVGVLDPGRDGMPRDVWSGTSRAEGVRLIQDLPGRIPSPTLYGLVRRLLRSAATPPQGEAPVSLAAVRVAALASMGDLDGAAELLDRLPAAGRDETFARLAADLALLRHRIEAACETAGTAIQTDVEPYWQKLVAFCQARAGERERAALTVGLLREAGHRDPAFFALIETLLGFDKARIGTLAQPSALHLAMLREAGLPVPADALPKARPALLRAIATSPNAAPEVRGAAAERAAAAHALPPERLADVYRGLEEGGEPAARAALYRAALRARAPAERAAALQQLLDAAREADLWWALAPLAALEVDRLEPSLRLSFFAEDAARVLLAAGRPEPAMEWFRVALREAPGNPRAAAGAAGLWPLFRLADAEGAMQWSEPAFRDWWRRRADADPAAARRDAALFLALLDALDERVPQQAWSVVGVGPEAPGPLPPERVWQGLRSAAAGGRRAETILLAAIAMGGTEQAEASPALLHGVVRALRTAGLHDEARAVAVDAALAAGL